jgi:hypothetical protein
LFFFTRRSAASTSLRSTTSSSSFSSAFPERAFSCAAVRVSPLRFPLGLHPYPPTAAPVSRTSGAFRSRGSRSFRSPRRSVLRVAEISEGRAATRLGFALATTTSSDFSLRASFALKTHAALSGVVRRDLPR